jgi:hypothetical protein
MSYCAKNPVILGGKLLNAFFVNGPSSGAPGAVVAVRLHSAQCAFLKRPYVIL